MNRDEKLARVAGLPPSKKMVSGRTIFAPSEPSGGMWIALNDLGVTFALINWYRIAARVRSQPVSRGGVVNAVSTMPSPELAERALKELPLGRINPFRLIGVFPAAKTVIEWQWNLKNLTGKNHPWQTQQWISSGYDEPTAQQARGNTFRQAMKQKSAGSLAWLRRLHRSHSPKSGPFSTCMHRADAATVSYTEVVFLGRRGGVKYHGSAPCCAAPCVTQCLKFYSDA